jgi:hypothetical protein
MTDKRMEMWHRTSATNVLIFAIVWLGQSFLILMFVRWLIHGSAALYLFMVPWALFGFVIAMRPNWLIRFMQAWEKDSERTGEQLSKRLPPGFP